MAVTTIKATRVVSTILGVLARETVLARLVWRDAGGDFRGAAGDTITIRVPAYTEADSRDLRSGATRVASNLTERIVPVTLNTDLYKRVPITDEELTLDIVEFETQIITPVASSLVRGLETEIIGLLESSSYEFDVNFLDYPRPYDAVIRARRHLNDARVPMEGRALVVGSGVEELLLTDEQFVRADYAGDSDAFRSAMIGRVGGFNVFYVPGIPPNEAFAFHRTAFVLSTRAPMVPRGVPQGQGATMSYDGFALRTVTLTDPEQVVDQFNADVWCGTNIVRDYGTLDDDGDLDPGTFVFTPDPDPDLDVDTPLFVRAVHLSIGAS